MVDVPDDCKDIKEYFLTRVKNGVPWFFVSCCYNIKINSQYRHFIYKPRYVTIKSSKNAIIILTGLAKIETWNEIPEFDRLAKLKMVDTEHEKRLGRQ